ncbi:hypothetical protein KI387_020368, partial [Taxus chinensis]
KHEQKDERKHEEQENEENVGKIPRKSRGINGIEHIGDGQTYGGVPKSLLSSIPIQFCCFEPFDNNMSMLRLHGKPRQVAVHLDQQAKNGVITIHMTVKEENDDSIFQFHGPMKSLIESYNVCGYQELQILEEFTLKILKELGFHLKNDEIRIHRN